NERYLPGVQLPRELRVEPDLPKAIIESECIVAAVPSKAFREVTQKLADFDGLVVSVTKGIEDETCVTMCGVLAETAPKAQLAALSGPTFALEVARGMPTAIVAASNDANVANRVQKLFHRTEFRVYTSTDLTGVELGGALKNVIAIAAGVCDGLGFGDNSKAALITRAMAEVRRLGVICNAQAETFSGLSGLGDLTATCFSKLSRNRGFGERLGRGEKLGDVLRGMISVAEGYPTSRSAYHLARKKGASTPVIDEVYQMLFEGKNVAAGVRDLMSRDSKAED
ncbi:MAG TPA: NAD(P)H-dependent glycerol-3-phosphate dehydrogenase, partial [Verrucomicrobiae bacterium]|nr:NAD(P)H-dependent glycerol-3-phosphate dehydrogenase [Verrucomicrobiae bacterium]